jgi:hypothetical protein
MSEMVATGSHYTDDIRRQAAAVYAFKGTQTAVERELGIPQSTVNLWTQTEWWQSLVDNARAGAEDQYRAELHSIIEKANRETVDRLDNGDHIVTKDGIQRIPIKGKDAATIGAIAYDKMRLSLNMPTSITVRSDNKTLTDLADKFKALSNRFAKSVVDVQQPDADTQQPVIVQDKDRQA